MDDVVSNVELMTLFGEFYEEIARVKVAVHEGRLAAYLSSGVANVTVDGQQMSGNDMAAMLQQRLKMRLQEQAKRVAGAGLQADIDAYRTAQYAMAVLADELFVIDVDWPGRGAWQHYLLEEVLFASSNGGRELFTRLDELLSSRARHSLLEDIAAVYLMTLRLGFQGQYRGSHGAPLLKNYCDRLVRFAGENTASQEHQPAFAQAYRHRIVGSRDERMAPISRWYTLGAIGAAVYVVISTVVWISLTDRFLDVFGNGG